MPLWLCSFAQTKVAFIDLLSASVVQRSSEICHDTYIVMDLHIAYFCFIEGAGESGKSTIVKQMRLVITVLQYLQSFIL